MVGIKELIQRAQHGLRCFFFASQAHRGLQMGAGAPQLLGTDPPDLQPMLRPSRDLGSVMVDPILKVNPLSGFFYQILNLPPSSCLDCFFQILLPKYLPKDAFEP